MSCPDAEKIELYIQGKLEGEELTEFETHSMSCPECQSKIQNAKANELLLSELKLLHNQDSSDYTKSMSSQKEMLTKGQAQKLLGERYVVVKKVSHDMQ
ncbi:MAG: zf-HC2 domain-containing protein, partial [Planctomycetes bacterium]|nr:zf-HC2 domain-containing protein [Planctomycetota bacterium]